MTMPAPVEAIIGLGLEVKGQAWDQLHKQLDRHVKDWNHVESTVGRIGAHVEGLSTRLMQLGGAVGLGAVINDFVQLENQANRTALAVGNVTGTSGGYRGLGQQMLGAGAATGFYGGELAQAIETLQTRAGGSYLGGPGHAAGVARALGMFAGAYSVAPGQLAEQIGGLELFQRQNPGSTGLLLQQMAAQAGHAGMAGQTGLFTQNVSSIASSLIAAHPSMAGPGENIRVGAMYGAAQLVNPAFRDAGVFGQGIGGIDSAVTGAYQNPRLQAVMQMAGIGYWQQRGGLAGPHGPEIARKLLAWSAAQYGQGSVAQDMFLRSNFGGNVSADLLQALASGKGAAAQRSITDAATNPSALAAAASAIHLRSEQYQTTPGAAAQRGRDTLERDVYGLFGNAGLDVMNWVGSHPVEAIGGALGLRMGLRRLGPMAGRFALRRGQAFAAQVAARAIAGAATGGGGAGAGSLADLAGAADGVAPDVFMGGAFSGAAEGEVGGRLLGLGFGSVAGGLAGSVAGAYGGLMLFPDSAGEVDPRGGVRASARHSRGAIEQGIVATLQRRYGNDWWMKAPALAAMSRLARQRSGDPRTRRMIEKQLRDAIGRQAGHVARAGREGPLSDFLSTALGGVPGIGGGLSGLFDLGAQMYSKGHPGHDAGGDLLHLLGHHGGPSGGVMGASANKFDHAVDKFGRIIAQMGLGPGRLGASFMGSGAGGMNANILNAGGLMGPNDGYGTALELARAVSVGSGAGSGGVQNLQAAALGIGGGGGTGGPGAVGGGGWSSCTLTWYDPALGGTNNSHGQRDPHARTASGEPYDAHKFTCAASAKFSFGTMVAIKTSKGTVTVKVNDRGSGVQGNHFDLSRAAWAAVGGGSNPQFKVVGHSGGKVRSYAHPQTSKAAAGDASGSGGDALAAALAWQSGGGGGGAPVGGGGGGGGGVVVNIDGRRIEHYQALTRRPV